MHSTALVYGFYGKKNLGDELFKLAFQKLFPTVQFKFVDRLLKSDLSNHQVIIFGGGSFLDGEISSDCSSELIQLLINKCVMYIGVGIETNINPTHNQLMNSAKLIATRSVGFKTKFSKMEGQYLEIPDIVYALGYNNLSAKSTNKSVLIIPNAELLPRHNSPIWKMAAWEHFKVQMAQFLDELKIQKYSINFLPMSCNQITHDLGAAVEIINRMKHGSFDDQLPLDQQVLTNNFTNIMNLISKYDLIISQRLHGSILAHLANKPCMVLSHHDKLANCIASDHLPYYEVSKAKLLKSFQDVKNHIPEPIKMDSFEMLKISVDNLLRI